MRIIYNTCILEYNIFINICLTYLACYIMSPQMFVLEPTKQVKHSLDELNDTFTCMSYYIDAENIMRQLLCNCVCIRHECNTMLLTSNIFP